MSTSTCGLHRPRSPKRVLLTTSAAPTQSPFSTSEKRPPLGIGFLISVLRDAGHEVFFIDNYLKPSDFLETGYLQEHSIDVAGIYANTICFRDTLRMLHAMESLRQTRQWQGKIVVGGPHTTVAPETIPDFVDHIVQGEGEQAVCDIVEGRVSERVVRYPRLTELDPLPRPAWDYFVDQPYRWDVNFFADAPVFTMNTSRGCPFQCTFCSVGSIWGRRYTCFSAERIVSDIEHLIENYGARGIYFREDNFTLDEKRLRRFCHLMTGKNLQIPWVCESRVSTLTRELVEVMVRAGLRGLYFGVESGSQRLLDFMRKGVTVAQIESAFRWCHECGVKSAASVVVGLPGETEADLTATRDLLRRVRPAVTWPNVFVGIPDSHLYRHVLKDRLYEYIDDRGLVYLQGHNDRVRRYYGGAWNAGIPDAEDKKDWTVRPKVSVLVAVHNGARYLRQALESIHNQTYQDFEVVVVDDGSTDETPDVLLEMKDRRTIVYRHAENQGLTHSLNVGLRLCRGEYVARMDADDLSAPQRFARQVEFLDRHCDVALVGSSYHQIDAAGKVAAHIEVPSEDGAIRERLKRKNCFGHGTVMIRRNVLIECGGYNEKYVRAQDYDLWLRIAETHRMANLCESLYFWRRTDECISRANKQEQSYYKQMAIREAEQRCGRSAACQAAHHLGRDARPLVSVIVPTHNRPQQLKRAITSVQSQTYDNIEIIVVNDAGTDAESVVRALGHHGDILYIRHGANKGLAAARNTGIGAAHGKYIAYLDDDDVYYPDHIETLVDALETTAYRVAHTQAHRSHQEKRGGDYIETKKVTPYTMDVTHDGLLVRNLVPVLCVMHERACLETVGYFDETLATHEDWDLWIRLSRQYEFLHVKRVTAQVTWRDDGTTMTSQRQQEFATVAETIYEKHRSFAVDKPEVLALQTQRLNALRQRANSLDLAASTPQRKVATTAAPTRGGALSELALRAGRRVPRPDARGAERALRVAVKVCTPSRDRILWGDTWFAQGLAKALQKGGHECQIHLRDAWDRPDTGLDVTIHIKGLYEYKPKPHSLNVIWIISHPERHRVEELNGYDAVFCASRKYLDHIQGSLNVPSFYLPQAADAEIFRPQTPGPAKDIDVLFVGNNYKCFGGQRRKIIDDVLATGRDYDLWIVGPNWEGMVDAKYLKSTYVYPHKLPELYTRAKIVLNDHHETMSEWGFVNDRTYNLAAIRAFQISNPVDAIDELGVVTYSDPADFREKLDYFLTHAQERERAAQHVYERCKDSTFDRAAVTILDVVRRRLPTACKEGSGHRKSLPSAARPKISVVTACHNAEPFLSECLDSILGQTLAEWELLLLDDGSNDGTRAIIERYAARDLRIRPFLFDDNKGPYVRRNHAINHARADFIAIHDADDLMYPNKLARLHEAVSQDPRLGVVGSFYRMFLDGRPELDHSEDVILPTTHEEILGRYLTEGICDFSWHGTAVIRKELFDVLGPYDENPFGADSLWLLKVLEYARRIGEIRLGNIPGFLTLRRMHLNSQTGRLPSFDPRSPRVMYWKHVVGKLEKVLKSVDADPRADVAAALRLCTGNDFFEQNGHLFEQWKKAPLTREIAQHLVSTIKCRFEHGKYIQSLIASEMVEQLVAGVASQVPFYDYIRGLAYFCLGFPAKSRECLEAETRAHGTSQAQDFLRRYVEKYNTAWDRRDRAEVGARARPNIPEGTDGGEAPDTASAMRIGRKPTVRQDMCRSRLGAAPGPVAAEPNDDRKRILAELDRKYRAMPDQAAAKHAVAVRLSELCRRVGLVDKSTELAMEAETLRRRGGVATSILPAQIGLRATAGG